jgi:hypothetical protein
MSILQSRSTSGGFRWASRGSMPFRPARIVSSAWWSAGRAAVLGLGGVLNYDMPEYGAAMRVKVLSTLFGRNTGISQAIAFGFAKKLY